MSERLSFPGRLRAACRILAGGAQPATTPAADPASLASQVASLELDLRDRDAQIARLRQEYAHQAQQAQQAVAEAGDGELAALAKRVAPLLSQLGTMQAMLDGGRELRAADVLKLAGKLKQVFIDCGLEPIGRVGELCGFDTRLHQRMSGGDVDEGQQVKVRFEGYRLREAIVTKAMVSREE
ncbi:MAG: hypothetical protein J5I93_13955 [Pirellulaceae bacterium]|nr:hypothetical protein [Pirellulaceae bacterium]